MLVILKLKKKKKSLVDKSSNFPILMAKMTSVMTENTVEFDVSAVVIRK